MVHEFSFLKELVLIAGAALVVLIGFQRLKLPPVIGFICTGLIFGPTGFGIIHSSRLVTTLSELGIILLMFSIGLEFSFAELKRLRKYALVGGLAQMLLSAAVLFGVTSIVFKALGVPEKYGDALFPGAFFVGLAFSVSSTAVCLKLLHQRRELTLAHGQISFGILLFQDLAVLPLLFLLNLLGRDGVDAASTGLSASPTGYGFATNAVLAVALFGSAWWLLPRAVARVADYYSKDVMVLGSLFFCFGMAYSTSHLGFSMPLGALVAGVIIAGTDDHHRILRATVPFRDLFTSLFFISIGLLLEAKLSELPFFIGAAVGVLTIKGLTVSLVARSLGASNRVSALTGIVLSQVGEFSFILSDQAFKIGIISSNLYHDLLGVIVFTLILTPFLIAKSPRLVETLSPALNFISIRRYERETESVPTEKNDEQGSLPPVVVIGYGTCGRNVVRSFKATRIAYRILEMNRSTVETLNASGETAVYGDCTEERALTKAGVPQASAIVVAISDASAVQKCVKVVRRMNPGAFVIVRVRYLAEMSTAYQAGASLVLPEEAETSIQIFSVLLRHFDVSSDVIQEQVEAIRQEHYRFFEKPLAARRENS